MVDFASSQIRIADVTGWTTFPVEGVGPLREPVAEYGGLVVIGRCLVDNSKSMLVSGRSPERIDHGHDGEPCLLNSTAGQGMTFHS